MNMKKHAPKRSIVFSAVIGIFLSLAFAIAVGISESSFLGLSVQETAIVAALVGFILGVAFSVYVLKTYFKNPVK